MHVRLEGCMWCYDNWNERVPTIKRDIELNINIRLLHIPSWWVTILSQCFVSSNWTQRIRSLVNFIICLEPPYLLDYNYIVVPLPTGFLWVHILMVKVCKNSSHISILPIDESNWTLHYNIHNTYRTPTSLGDCWSHIQISLLSWKISTNQNTYNVRAKLPCKQLQSFQALTFFSKLVEMRKIRTKYSIV
jgi:hypothetical protein